MSYGFPKPTNISRERVRTFCGPGPDKRWSAGREGFSTADALADGK